MNLKWKFLLIILTGLFILIEGNVRKCPEQTRPHLTRCDKYFRCMILPSNSYVWIPTQCERGLVYEASLKQCVMPGDDWECILSVDDQKQNNNDENNVYGVNNLSYSSNEQLTDEILDDQGIKISSLSSTESNEDDLNESDGENDAIEYPVNIEENRITPNEDDRLQFNDDDDRIIATTIKNNYNDDDEFSGDGPIEVSVEDKENNEIAIPSTDDPDNSLASHLQRLSQLIEHLRNKKANLTNNNEMAPDQLNSFLANHNIKSQYETIDFNNPNKLQLPANGRIDPIHLSEIIREQNKLNYVAMIKSTKPKEELGDKLIKISPGNPNTIIRISSKNPQKGYRIPESSVYSSSQIVVNRPEGSVLFNLPTDDNDNAPVKRPEPYISEETLKTVLELSKQMVASNNQNIKYDHLQDQSYLQPIVRPVYYNFPIPILSNQQQFIQSNHQIDSINTDEVDISPQSPSKLSAYINNMPVRKVSSSSNNNPTTIIKPDSIPITVTNSFNTYKDYPKKSTNLGSKQTINPGNNISTTLIFEPTFADQKNRNQNNYLGQNKNPISDYYNNKKQQSNRIVDSYGTDVNSQQNDYQNYPPFYNPYQLSPTTQLPNYLNQQTTNNDYGGSELPTDESYLPYQSSNTQNYPSSSSSFNSYQYPPIYYNPSLNNDNFNYLIKYPNSQYYQNPLQQTNYGSSIYPPQSSTSTSGSQTFYPATGYTQNFQQQQQQQQQEQQMINNNNKNQKKQLLNYQDEIEEKQEEDDEDEDNDDDDDDDDDDNDNDNVMVFNNNDDDDDDDDENVDNRKIVTNSLYNLEQQKQKIIKNSGALLSSVIKSALPQTQLFNQNIQQQNDDDSDTKNKLVNLAGNFISYDRYKQTILPLLQQSTLNSNELEILTCTAGVRQPNSTDCTKYYVCNPKDGNVLSYDCPAYTGFSKEGRICDAQTYAMCKPEAIMNRITIADNIRAQEEAQLILKEAQKLRKQAIQEHNEANAVRLKTQKIKNSSVNVVKRKRKRPPQKNQLTHTTTVPKVKRRPTTKVTRVTTTTTANKIKINPRQVGCRGETGKIPDANSILNYFVCFRATDGKLKRMRMTCSAGLIFCKKIKLCTLANKCN